MSEVCIPCRQCTTTHITYGRSLEIIAGLLLSYEFVPKNYYSYFSTKEYVVGTQKKHQKHMLKLMGKKISTTLRSKNVFNLNYGYGLLLMVSEIPLVWTEFCFFNIFHSTETVVRSETPITFN